jgi:hypothetical protein
VGKPVYDVKEGAKLECSLGTCNSFLQIPNGHGCSMKDQNQATINDFVGNVNILPFCLCKKSSPPVPCTPTILMSWLNGQSDFKIRSVPALLDTGIVPCVFGGIIKIVEPGQK